MSQSEYDQLIEEWIIKHKLIVCYIGIFCGLVMFYGMEDDNAEFFEQGNGVNAEYQVLYAGDYYHLGEVVSHWANIAVLTIIGIIFMWMLHAFIEGHIEARKK